MNTYSLSSGGTADPIGSAPSTLQDVTNFMIRRAGQLVDELVKQRGREEPPFSAEELAPLQGIKRIEKLDLGEFDAVLFRTADGYIIKVNAIHSPERQNFSCAHEIAHTFLHELESRGSTQSAEFRTVEADMSSRAKERLCQIAAAELLMPEQVFREYLLSFGISADSIERLAHVFKVSPEAAAIRISKVSTEPCILLKWARFQKAKSKGFVTKDKSKHVNEGKHVYVRDPSALLKAYESHISVKSFRSFEIGNVRKRCLMDSKGFGRDKMRYVLSLVFPERQRKA